MQFGPTPPILAFGFGAPLLLWGLALGGVPLLIHLLNKRKFRETQWAAMRFLLEAVRKNSRRMRIEQLLLLVVRTLIVLFLVLALSQPHFAQLGRYFSADVPVHKILVLDTSFSMGYEPAAQSRFSQAKELARRIVLDARQGDAINVVRISGFEPRVIVAKPSFRDTEVIDEIGLLQPTHERGDVLAALVEVGRLLRAAPEIPAKEIYLISDFQRVSWTPDAVGKPGEIRDLLKKFSEEGNLTLLDLGQTGSQNNAITEFRALDSFVTVGQAAHFRVGVTTFGNALLLEQTLEFLVDGKVQSQQKLDLQPATEASVDFTHTFATGGEHRLQVRLAKDYLSIDDQRWLALPVKEHIRVLCVNGKLSGEPRGNATFNLQLALAPGLRKGASPSRIQPQVIKYGELRGFDLSNFDCIFLCNISAFDAGEVELLNSYLKSGGGVIWCLGDRVQPENYNRMLYRDGEGILPAKIGKRHGDALKQADVFHFDPLDFTHPIVKPFQGNPGAGLASTRTYEYFAASAPEHAHARVALAFNSGDPAIIEAQVGPGRAILVTTAVDESWGSWALWPSFVPLIQEMVVYAVSGQAGQRQHTVGDPLLRVVQTRGADVTATILRPDGQTDPLQISQGANLSDFAYEKTDTSGFYEVRFGPPIARSETFAVNVDPRESNLLKLEKDELAKELLPAIDFTYRTDWAHSEARTAGPVGERGGLTRWLLYLTLYLLFVEQMLAWNFTYGWWLLCPPLFPIAWLFSRRAPGKVAARTGGG